MIRYNRMSGRIRVARARKDGRFVDSERKKSDLLIRLRGWKGVFKQLRANGKKIFYITRVREMSHSNRREYLASRRMKHLWYTRCYMIGKGGIHRKLAIKLKLFRQPRRKAVPGTTFRT